MSQSTFQLDDRTLGLLRSGLRIVALRSLGDPEAAEEAAQEALVRGLDALKNDRIENPEKLGAYFRGIVRHVIADRLRESKRTISLERLPEYPAKNPAGNTLERLITEEQRKAVARVIPKLSRQARECLYLSFVEGLPPREIAKKLGEPASRIRKRRSRALQKIREILRDGTGPGGRHETEPKDTSRTGSQATEGPRGPKGGG